MLTGGVHQYLGDYERVGGAEVSGMAVDSVTGGKCINSSDSL